MEDETHEIIPGKNRKLPFISEDIKNKKILLQNASETACTKFYRADFLLGNSLTFPEGLVHEDNYFFWISIAKANKITSIPDVLYYYRQRSGSIMQDLSLKRLDIIRIYPLVKNDLVKCGCFDDFRELFLSAKLHCIKHAYNPKGTCEFRETARSMFLESVDEEEMDHFRNSPLVSRKMKRMLEGLFDPSMYNRIFTYYYIRFQGEKHIISPVKNFVGIFSRKKIELQFPAEKTKAGDRILKETSL